jgi:hypothetical protein
MVSGAIVPSGEKDMAQLNGDGARAGILSSLRK